MSIEHYFDGLFSGIELKTGRLLAERVGEARPIGARRMSAQGCARA